MSLKFSSALTSASGVFRLLLGIATGPLLIVSLGLTDYGIWTIVNSVVAIALLAGFGLDGAVLAILAADVATGDRNQARRTLATSMFLVIGLGCATAFMLLAFSGPINSRLFADANDARAALPAFLLLCCTIPLRLWQTWAVAVESAAMRYDLQTAVELPSGSALQVGWVATATLGGGVLSLAAVQLVIQLVTCAAHVHVLRKVSPETFGLNDFSRTSARRLLRFGGLHWITIVAVTLFNNADRLIVNAVMGVHATSLYSAVVSLANKIIELASLPIRVLPPSIAQAWARKNQPRIRYLYGEAIRVTGTVILVSAAGLLFFAPILLRIVVGTQDAVTATPALQSAALIYSIYGLFGCSCCFAFGMGRPMILARWAFLGPGLMAPLMYVSASKFGLTGAIWANAAGLLIVFVTVEVSRLISLPLIQAARTFAPPLVALTVCFGVTHSAAYHQLSPWIQVLFFCLFVPPLATYIVSWPRLRELASEFAKAVSVRATFSAGRFCPPQAPVSASSAVTDAAAAGLVVRGAGKNDP
jgi:O-antigen/teichoic acid export membrane protein